MLGILHFKKPPTSQNWERTTFGILGGWFLANRSGGFSFWWPVWKLALLSRWSSLTSPESLLSKCWSIGMQSDSMKEIRWLEMSGGKFHSSPTCVLLGERRRGGPNSPAACNVYVFLYAVHQNGSGDTRRRCQSAIATGANVQLSGCIWVPRTSFTGFPRLLL